jgi:hypothetical protein
MAKANEDMILDRLLYVLHRGFVEARLLAAASKDRRLEDLADTMELLPCYMHRRNEEELEIIRFGLQRYQAKYHPPTFDYVGCLTGQEPIHWLKGDRNGQHSSIREAENLLRDLLSDVKLGASCCTFYVRDPWWQTSTGCC